MGGDTSSNAINDARIKAGFTVKALAEFLDAPYSTMKDSCSGKHKMPRWVEKLVLEKLAGFSKQKSVSNS